MLFHIKICKYLAISDNILNNDALKHNGSELKHETWTQLLQKLQIYEKGMDHIQHLRTRWVLGAAEYMSGGQGSKQNDKELLDYSDEEWSFIWHTM